MSHLDKHTAMTLFVLWALALIALMVVGYAMVVMSFPSIPPYGYVICVIVWFCSFFFACRKLNYFFTLFLSAVSHDEHEDEGSPR